MQEEHEIKCPFCGETISILIDISEVHQVYVEDCSVCCKPIEFEVQCRAGAIFSVDFKRS